MIQFVSILFLLTTSAAQTEVAAKPAGSMLCRTKQYDCDYSCPKGYSRNARVGCTPLRGSNCPPTGILAGFRPMETPKNAYIAWFGAEGPQFTDLLCKDLSPERKSPRRRENPIVREYQELFGN